MRKFDKLFNKIMCEQKMNKSTKKVIKEQTEDQDLFRVFYDTMMVDILDNCQNIKQWARQGQDYTNIAKDFITDIYMDFGDEIIDDMFDNIVTGQDYWAGTPEQQNEWMTKAIIEGGWLAKINEAAFGYADNYIMDDDENDQNPEDNIEQVPEDFREVPVPK